MNTLIYKDQQCAVKGREIHLHNIRNLITYCRDKQTKACILSIDQKKAFDRVDHNFLRLVLKECNIGKYFRDWVQIMYDNPTSRVLVNQNLMEEINIESSVRQGCSLSPLLYTLALEPVLQEIRERETIKGVKIPGNQEAKIKANADDTIVFLTKINNIKEIIEIFKTYGKGSGSNINIKKTGIMKIEREENEQTPLELTFEKEMKIYGITFINKPNLTPVSTWINLIKKKKKYSRGLRAQKHHHIWENKNNKRNDNVSNNL